MLLCLIHAPYTFVNYAMGGTRVRVRTFAVGHTIGPAAGECGLGVCRLAVSQPARHRPRRSAQAWTPDVVLALLVVAFFPLIVRAPARRPGRRRIGGGPIPAGK